MPRSGGRERGWQGRSPLLLLGGSLPEPARSDGLIRAAPRAALPGVAVWFDPR